MARRPQGYRRKIKNTGFGKRALSAAKMPASRKVEGRDKLGDSSILSATIDIPGPGGRTDVAVIPTIRRMPDGNLRRLSSREAARIALKTGDFARVRGGTTSKEIERARARGDKISRKFSRKLGRLADKNREK